MLYAIGEILVFLIVAVMLGLILGWLMRGLFLRKRLETAWRTECDQYRERAEHFEKQLEECLGDRKPVQLGKSARKKQRETKKVEIAVTIADKKTAQEKVRDIALRTAGDQPVQNDDLKKLRGIGPALEKSLKSMRITSFRQIANFTQDDIRYVTTALESFPGRIERDNWTQSAKEEFKKKYGEDP